ncbi:MAG: AMP-binding protein [Steroidobacteraceae bacterium]
MATEACYNAAVDFIDRQVAGGLGERLAVCDPLGSLTYAGLLAAAARVGTVLAGLGVGPEQRIAVVLFDTVEFAAVFWGAIRAGIVPVLLNTRLTAQQYRYMIEDSRARVVLASPALLPVVEEAVRGLAMPRTVIAVGPGAGGTPDFAQLVAAADPAPAAATSPDEVAYWLYSSGTTGNPKGVMHVHTTPRSISE